MEPNLENDLNLRDDEQRAASLRALEELEGLTGDDCLLMWALKLRNPNASPNDA